MQTLQIVAAGRDAKVATLIADCAVAREGHGGKDPVWLLSDANRRYWSSSRYVTRKEQTRHRDVGAREHRRQHLFQRVTERRLPKRRVHRPSLTLIRPGGIRHALHQRVIDPQSFRKPLPVPSEERIVGFRIRFLALEDDVVARIRIVHPGVPCSAKLRVVGRAALRYQAEAVLARVMMRNQSFELLFPVVLVRGKANAENHEPVEAGGRLRRGQIDFDSHSQGDCALEIAYPEQVVVQGQIVADMFNLVARRQRRIRSSGEAVRDGISEGSLHLGAAVGQDRDKTVGKRKRFWCLGPRTLLGGWRKRELQERATDAHLGSSVGLGWVLPVWFRREFGADFVSARGADSVLKCGAGDILLGLVAVGLPDGDEEVERSGLL